MAAVSFSPSTAAKTPEQVIDEHADAIADICKKLMARTAHLEKENAKVHAQLDDAIDRVHELERDLLTARRALVAT